MGERPLGRIGIPTALIAVFGSGLADSKSTPHLGKSHASLIEFGSLCCVRRLNPSMTFNVLASFDEMSRDCAAMCPKRLTNLFHAHAARVELDDLVDLSFSEESLSFPDRPDDSTSFVTNGRFEGALVLLVEAAPPPRDNGL